MKFGIKKLETLFYRTVKNVLR